MLRQALAYAVEVEGGADLWGFVAEGDEEVGGAAFALVDAWGRRPLVEPLGSAKMLDLSPCNALRIALY